MKVVDIVKVKSRMYYNKETREILEITGEYITKKESYKEPVYKFDGNEEYDFIELEFGKLGEIIDSSKRYARGFIDENGIPVIEYMTDEDIEIEEYLNDVENPRMDAEHILSQANERVLEQENADLLLMLAESQLGGVL